MENKVEVSVVCNTYNQELYVEDTLKGFVSQKTNFEFEVLIHDDASTDKTAEIIRNYCDKYPEIFRPILQEKNKYSKGVFITETYQIPRATGKYIAFCEGDDYWIDPYKLQKQYDILEKSPQVDMCAHKTKLIDGKTNEFLNYVEPAKEDVIISPEEVILGGGGFVSSCSLFFRKELFENPPEFRKKYNYDYSLQIYGSLRGGMYYLSDCMAVYRWHTLNSWTDIYLKNKNKKFEYYQEVNNMLNQFDEDTKYKYTDSVKEVLDQSEFHMLEGDGQYKKLLNKRFKKMFKKMPLKYRLYIIYKGLINR